MYCVIILFPDSPFLPVRVFSSAKRRIMADKHAHEYNFNL